MLVLTLYARKPEAELGLICLGFLADAGLLAAKQTSLSFNSSISTMTSL